MDATKNMNKRDFLITEEQRKELGAELTAWRLRTGRTQKSVAQDLGMSRWTIGRIERDAKEVEIGTAYRVYVYLARELKKEAMASTTIEQYAVDRAITLGKQRIDQETTVGENDWQLTKED